MYEELVKQLRASEAYGGEDAYMIGQAADAIEERCQQVDKFMEEAARLYSKQPKWIPVKERLPDEDDEVLVVAVNVFNHDDRWVSIDWLYSGGWQQHEIVTHWMPLPTPPKEET